MAQLKDLIVTGPSRFVGTVYVNNIQGKISNASVADSANSVAWSNITGKPTDHATTSYVDSKIAALVNGAPAALDTLDELAAALKDNKDIVTVLEQSIGNKQDKSTAITTSNIGSQSVDYANSAGSATDQTARNAAATAQSTANGKWTWNASDVAGVKVNNAGYADSAGSVAWGNVSGRPSIPTHTSHLTNNSGYITGITKQMVVDALGYTPPTSDTNSWRPIYNGVDSTSTDTSASANAVKTAYDTAVSAYNLANGKWTYDASTIAGVKVNNAGYADSAGSANSVAWSNVSGRPTSVSQFTNDSGYFNASNVWNNPENVTISGTVAPTEMYNSIQGFISNGTVAVKNGTLYVTDNPFMPTSTHWLDAYSDPNSYGGYDYRGQIELDLYPDRFYDFTYTPLISGIKINSIPGWNTDGLISHNIVRFRPGMGGFTLTVPSGIYWANGVPTEFENNNAMYELSFIRRGIDSITATWTKFTLE